MYLIQLLVLEMRFLLGRCQVSFRLVGGIRVLYDMFRENVLAGRQIPFNVLQILILAIDAAVRGNGKLKNFH